MGDEVKSTGRNWLMALFILAVFLMVSSYLLVLLMGYGFMFFSPGGLAVSSQVFPAPIYLFFFLFGFDFPALGGFMFIFVFAVYVICFIAAWRWRESFHRVVANAFSRPFRRLFDNFLFIMPLLSSMALTAVLAIFYAQDLLGIPTGQAFPGGTPLPEQFLTLSFAPVTEELGFRLVPIGLFIVFYVFLVGKNVGRGSGLKRLVASFVYPDGAKRMSGLPSVSEHGIKRGISQGEWIMILVTSLVFAVAHVISPGTSWDIGKITSVIVQALFFGIAYLAYGFEAPILLHWFFDYYSFFFDSNLLSSFFPGTEPVLSVIDLLIVVLGVAGWVIFAVYGLRWLNKRRKGESPEPMSAPPRPPLTLPS